MSDIFAPNKRAAIMSKIGASGNIATEVRLAKLFKRQGITGWRRGARVFGRPDFVFRPQRVALFVDGCFWHGCPLHASVPKTNTAFWRAKIDRNRWRDREVNRVLSERGWTIVRVWQHELRVRNERRLLARIGAYVLRSATIETNLASFHDHGSGTHTKRRVPVGR